MSTALSYREDETDKMFIGLVQQWSARHKALVQRLKLIPINNDDAMAAQGQITEFDDYMDYQDDVNRRFRRAGMTILCTVEEPSRECKAEYHAIISIFNGFDSAEKKADLLVKAGYTFPEDISSYIQKQRSKRIAFEKAMHIDGNDYD
ncbi:MAG TPA: hypothetical protein PKD55_20190 [Bellilinea sp.]|nr:hypothetical protein [Bellilinea sp.]